MTETIRITDLADPDYTPDQLAVREMAESFHVDFQVDTILAAARDRTGLDDFGPMDFVERLEILCRAVDADTGLHSSGRASVYFVLLRNAEARLRIHDTLLRHPEIHDERIDRPVVIAGLPRSGTTHLLNLMAADRRFRSLPYWESCEPVPTPGETEDRSRRGSPLHAQQGELGADRCADALAQGDARHDARSHPRRARADVSPTSPATTTSGCSPRRAGATTTSPATRHRTTPT